MRVGTVLLLCVALCAPAFGTIDPNVIGQTMGNSDLIQVRVGLGNAHTSWGLTVAHEPETELREQTTSVGVFGMLATDVPLIAPGAVPGLWAGLNMRPFIDLDVMYDFEFDRIAIWPGAGVIVEPSNTMSFVFRAIYPVGDEGIPSAMDLNSLTTMLGLQIKF